MIIAQDIHLILLNGLQCLDADASALVPPIMRRDGNCPRRYIPSPIVIQSILPADFTFSRAALCQLQFYALSASNAYQVSGIKGENKMG